MSPLASLRDRSTFPFVTLSRSRRWAARLLLPLFLLLAAEPLRALECSAHLGMAGAATQAEDSHGEYQAAGHDAHGEHDAPEGHQGQENHRGHDAHSCDCVGDCTTVAAVRIAALPVVPTTIVAYAEPALPVKLGVAPAVRPDRLLPFANGPPTPA